MNKLTEQQQQIPLLSPNGDIGGISIEKENNEEQQLIEIRINELEQELNRLRLQLSKLDKDD
jgi:hypothetical protein